MSDEEPREDQLQAFEQGQDIRDRTFGFVCRIGPLDEAGALRIEATALVAIIGAIIRNTRRNAGLEPRRSMKARIPHS